MAPDSHEILFSPERIYSTPTALPPDGTCICPLPTQAPNCDPVRHGAHGGTPGLVLAKTHAPVVHATTAKTSTLISNEVPGTGTMCTSLDGTIQPTPSGPIATPARRLCYTSYARAQSMHQHTRKPRSCPAMRCLQCCLPLSHSFLSRTPHANGTMVWGL